MKVSRHRDGSVCSIVYVMPSSYLDALVSDLMPRSFAV
jgi:hypothetical protein